MNKNKGLVIRSSAAEFLIFESQKHEKGIEVRFEDGDLWLTQKLLGDLFDTTRNNITMHIKDIYNSNELDEKATSKDFLLVQDEGNRKVSRSVKYYNLDIIISVGYRVNSDRAIQFRRWATNILKEFAKKGYIIDKRRMENGTFFDEDYFESLLAEINEIRLSERRFYQKITDIYATRIDKYLLSDDRDILKDAGEISHEIACEKALTEFEKYRVKQDKLYKSDFDKMLEETKEIQGLGDLN